MTSEALAHNGEVKDPAGHLKLSVADFAVSCAFYRGLFGELDYAQVSDKTSSAGWVTPAGFGIWIAQAEVADPAHMFGAPGFHHLCLKARTPEEVDAVHGLLVQRQAHIFNPPRSYPEYTANYYAVFFADPDGMKLEVAYY